MAVSCTEDEAAVCVRALQSYSTLVINEELKIRERMSGAQDQESRELLAIVEAAKSAFEKARQSAAETKKAVDVESKGARTEHLQACSAAISHHLPIMLRQTARTKAADTAPEFPNEESAHYSIFKELRQIGWGSFRFPTTTVTLTSDVLSALESAIEWLRRAYREELRRAAGLGDDTTIADCRLAVSQLTWRKLLLDAGEQGFERPNKTYSTRLLVPKEDFSFLLGVCIQYQNALESEVLPSNRREDLKGLAATVDFLKERCKGPRHIDPCLYPDAQVQNASPFRFVKDKDWRRILERDYAELRFVRKDCIKATVVLAGSILEAVLDHLIERLDAAEPGWPSQLDTSKLAQDIANRVNHVKKKSDLWVKIEAIRLKKLFPPVNQSTFDPLRDYRNYVHPGKEISQKQVLNGHHAEICWHMVEDLLGFLAKQHDEGTLPV